MWSNRLYTDRLHLDEGRELVKKAIIIATTLTALPISSHVMANDNGLFLGGSVGWVETSAKDEWNTLGWSYSNTEDSDTETSGNLKFGTYQGNVRLYADAGYVSWSGLDLTTVTANADYLFNLAQNFSLFAGVHIGYAKADLDQNYFRANMDDPSGLALGGQLGGIFTIPNSPVSLEASYRYTHLDIDSDYSYYNSFVRDRVDGTFTLEDLSGFYLGANVRF